MIKKFITLNFLLFAFILLSKNCDAQRIVGGNVTDIKDIPYQVALIIRVNRLCGGSFIFKRWILTAAHCVYDETADQIWVHFGSNTTTGGWLAPVQAIYSHNNYDSETFENDIALLKLFYELFNSDTIYPRRPIDLAESLPSDNSIVLVSGYGATSENGPLSKNLMSVNVSIINIDVCNNSYSGIIKRGMFCAALPNKDSCQGDSGGPVAFNNELIGLVSWGFGCAEPDYPGVYTDVSYFYEWICRTILSTL